MKVAIISDIHDNFHNLVLFLERVKEYDVEKIIFLGDFINNGIAKILANVDIPVITIWGNNDGEKVEITKTSLTPKSNMVVSSGTYDFLEIDSRKIFITHYPSLAKPMAKSGDFDAVFYGHNHKKNLDKINDCIIVNPGEISAHKTGFASFAIYETKKNKAEIIKIDKTISTKTDEVIKYLRNINVELSKSATHKY